jgi:hypothetical protein
MSHGTRKDAQNYNSSHNASGRVTLPFKRKARVINGSLRVTIPSDYVKNFNLEPDKAYQFYIEVSP